MDLMGSKGSRGSEEEGSIVSRGSEEEGMGSILSRGSEEEGIGKISVWRDLMGSKGLASRRNKEVGLGFEDSPESD